MDGFFSVACPSPDYLLKSRHPNYPVRAIYGVYSHAEVESGCCEGFSPTLVKETQETAAQALQRLLEEVQTHQVSYLRHP